MKHSFTPASSPVSTPAWKRSRVLPLLLALAIALLSVATVSAAALTDAPSIVGASGSTRMLVGRPDTTVASLNRISSTPNKNPTVTWQVVFAAPVNSLTPGNFTLVNTGLGGTPVITGVMPTSPPPATTWNITANTGSGQGTLGLNMVNDAGLSHGVTNLTFTGEVFDIDHVAPTTSSFTRLTPATSPTNADTLIFRVTFSENVTGVSADDFAVTGTTATITEFTSGGSSGPYDITIGGGDLASLNGVVGLNYSGALNITDLAGNPLANSEPTTDETYTLDNIAPAAPAVVAPANGSSTNDDTPTMTGTAEASSTITVYIDSASAGTTTADASGNWSFTPGTALTETSHTVKATAADGAGNTSADSNTNTFTVDTLPPPAPVVQTPGNGSSTNDTTPTVTGTAETSATVTVFIDNSSVGTTTADASGNWSFTPGTALSATTHTVKSQTTDAAGNTSVSSNTNTFMVDTTAPTVTINQAAGQSDPASSSPISLTVIFSEAVTGFATGDVTLSGSAGATTGTITGGPTTYNVAVSGMTGDGTLLASLAAGVAQDAAGNGTIAATSTDNSVLYDTATPTVTINQASGQADPTTSGPISFRIVFSEAVTGFATGDVTLVSPFGSLTGIVTEIAPNDGTTYNMAVSGMSGEGTITATIAAAVATDLASKPNNSSTSTDNMVAYDATAPTVTSIVRADASPTSAASGSLIITFSEAVSGVNTSDFSFTSSGVTGAAISGITGSGTTFTVTVDLGTGDGILRLNLLDDDTIVDGANNPLGGTGAGNGSYTNGELYAIDRTGPFSMLITPADGMITNAATVTFNVIFSESVTGVSTDDFSLASSGMTGASINGVSGSGSTRTVSVSTGSGNGTLGLNLVDDDSIVDLRGNPLGGSGTGNGNATGQLYTIDRIAPEAGNLLADDITSAGTTYSFTVVFSDNLLLFTPSLDANDIQVTGPGGFDQIATLIDVNLPTNGTPRTATYSISAPGDSWDTADNGSYTVALQANQVRDLAGNCAAASTLGAFSVDIPVDVPNDHYTIFLPMMNGP